MVDANGLSVNAFIFLISFRIRSVVSIADCVFLASPELGPKIPNPPASLTALINSGLVHEFIAPWSSGFSIFKILVTLFCIFIALSNLI